MSIQDIPQFTSLSDEAKKIVLSKYEALSPQAKVIVDKKINSSIQGPAGQPRQGYIPSQDPTEQQGLISEIPGLSPALTHGTTPLAEAIGETTQIPQSIRGPLSGTVGIAPELLMATQAPKLASMTAEAVSPALKSIGRGIGRAGEVAFAPLKSTSNAAINAAEQGAGVVLRSPVTKQMAQELGLKKGAQSFSEVSNSIKSTLDSGGRIPLQVAKDFLNKADTVFKTAMGKAEKAALSQSVAAVRAYLNKEIPGRAIPAAKLANSYLRSNIVKGATGGALIEGIRRLYNWGKR